MRIGFDAKRAYHNRSGLGNYSRDIIRMLCDHFPGHEYFLYNPKNASISFDPGPCAKEVLPSSFFSAFFSSVWRRKGIVQQLKQDKLDLYHGLSNELPFGIAGAGIRSVVTIHDLIFYKYPQWYKPADRIIHQQKAAQACWEADHIIAISEQTKNDIIEFLKVDEKKITVIYQGCHPAFKKKYNAVVREVVRQKFKIPADFILSVGTIEPRKNLLTTVKSLLFHELPLVVIGKKTHYFREISAFIHKHQLQSRVHFLEGVSIEELAAIYQSACAFCYPSIYEGFGIPIIEALYSRTPVISNKKGCFKEAGGPDSFYIDHDNAEQLAGIVQQLQSDRALYQAAIEAGELYAQRFNDDIIAGQVMELYQKIKAS